MIFSNLITFLADVGTLCNGLEPVLRLVGFVVLGIKIGVPIILIVIGMADLAGAVTQKDESKIKEAQKKLVSKAVAAVMVFLVVTIVGVLMGLVGTDTYKGCMKCINNPTDCKTATD